MQVMRVVQWIVAYTFILQVVHFLALHMTVHTGCAPGLWTRACEGGKGLRYEPAWSPLFLFQAGVANADYVGKFKYYDTRYGNAEQSSVNYVRQVLSIFMQGSSVNILDSIYVHTESVKQPKEEHREAFRKKLCEAVRMLTGTEPRFTRQQVSGLSWVLHRE